MVDYSPVVILGFPRSGTTALYNALVGAPWGKGGFCGLPDREGHYLDWLLEGLHRRERSALRKHRARVSIAYEDEHWRVIMSRLAESVTATFLELAGRSADEHPRTRWIDKTPHLSYIAVAPEIHLLFPNVRLLYAVRNPLDGLYSYRRKVEQFDGQEFDLAKRAGLWASFGRQWRATRAELPARSWLEVRHEELADSPEDVARNIIEHLRETDNLPAPPGALEALAGYLTDNKDFSSFGAERSWTHADQWTERERETILDACGDEMSYWGY